MAPWEEISARKRADREALLAAHSEWRIPPPADDVLDVSGFMTAHLTPRERDVVKQDATAILHELSTGRISAVEVTTAFCKVATISQDLTNCVTEICFNDALKRAQELDDIFKATGKVVGPLHGLPVSIKDHIKVKGLDTATGYIAWAYKTVADKDASVVEILRSAGAIIYVKTANPQTLMSLETNNNIYGRTLNPFNRNLTSGGSSGGESALIASFGSPLGVGTDIGGSIVRLLGSPCYPRACPEIALRGIFALYAGEKKHLSNWPSRGPAGCTGIYGFKASVARMPHAGLLGNHHGMDAIVGVVGPMARSLRDIALFCRVMSDYKSWLLEHAVLDFPWREEIVRGIGQPEKLTVAILWDDGFVRPHPPILSALEQTKRVLLAAGHEVIDWEPLKSRASWDLITALYFLDGGAEFRAFMAESDEPPVPGTEWILSHTSLLGREDDRLFTIPEIFTLNVEREAFRAKVLQHWNETAKGTKSGRSVDCVLTPVMPTLAPAHNTTRWWGYTSYWNLVDYPAAVFPFPSSRLPSASLDEPLPPARNEIEAFVRDQWNPSTYANAPVALQLVGRRLNEEKVLYMVDTVESAIRDAPSSGKI